MARSVSVAELKARLSEFVAAARAGDDVIVTHHGRPVARLAALEGGRALDGRLADLVRTGLARQPRRRVPRTFLTESRPADPQGRSLEAVLEERSEGW